eukprot:CAMPEP_0115398790 /NCGR_PEP_ID=MMETSP0271-20121206/14499_1 /TAXON_ID=71861 /ORGANISM="Scrippsiella trochoidea, Strain CCMP3099" /LENGTH=401 /DNA_ID=CAMNT_0002822575 /DNA_START=39 /DNA_END=1244 /DNA_ORIENTATION=-
MITTQAMHDEYLESKLRVVLESLVEALLTEKPEDSQAFCMEWLARWYADHDPEQEELSKLRAERELLQVTRNKLYEQANALGLLNDEIDDGVEQEKIARMKDADRRAGVSAPAISEDRMKAWQKPYYEKSPEACGRIKSVIDKNDKLNVLFGHLAESAVFDVIDAMKPVSVEIGSDLIVQGDEGDNFYIVDEGSFDIFVKRGDAPPGKVLECGPGAMFGELALMYNAPRAATVTATSPGKVWALDRESFQMMLATAENMKKSQYEEFLSNIELFQHMTKYEIAQLSDLLESELYDTNEDIMKQGDEGVAFYILEDGEAKAYISGEQGEVEVKHYQTPGDFFGEVALITNAPRRATVRAVGGGCTVLVVTVDDFDKVLGPIRDVLEKNIDKYPRYADLIRAS